ncbi:MAG: DUF2752 domain-containing protein [Erysipelotrichia bacterium]|nr:DUF2752 domain-containing protein [Erysipelotrichia bacterium]NCC54832.1 DUF2752 domain-containing protein [Erysipelotrichia bacterium]
MQDKTVLIKKIVAVIVLIVAIFLFYETWCPFEQIIGIPCPGCNMLSACYHLLHGDIKTALYFHPLVIVFCFYALLELICFVKYRTLKNKPAYYLRIIFFTLLTIVYIYRMCVLFPNYPMSYNENSLLGKIISFIK